MENLLQAMKNKIIIDRRAAAACALGQGKPYLLSPKPLATLSSGTKSGWDMFFQVTKIR